jgi:hypothetical protein
MNPIAHESNSARMKKLILFLLKDIQADPQRFASGALDDPNYDGIQPSDLAKIFLEDS